MIIESIMCTMSHCMRYHKELWKQYSTINEICMKEIILNRAKLINNKTYRIKLRRIR